jgi:hypothetical protein
VVLVVGGVGVKGRDEVGWWERACVWWWVLGWAGLGGVGESAVG